MLNIVYEGLNIKVIKLLTLLFVGVIIFLFSVLEAKAEIYLCPDGSQATNIEEQVLAEGVAMQEMSTECTTVYVGGTGTWCTVNMNSIDSVGIYGDCSGTSTLLDTKDLSDQNYVYSHKKCVADGVEYDVGDTQEYPCYRLVCQEYFHPYDIQSTQAISIGILAWVIDPSFTPPPSCSPPADNPDPPSTEEPDIDMIVWDVNDRVNQGQDATFDTMIYSRSGFYGNVNLSVDDCPTSSCTFDTNPLYIPGSYNETYLRVGNTEELPPGTYYVTVRAEGASDPWNINDWQTVDFEVVLESSNTARVQGCRKLMPGNIDITNPSDPNYPITRAPVTIEGKTTTAQNLSGGNCYWILNLTTGNAYTVNIENVPGYTVGYTLCPLNTTSYCHNATTTMGNSVNVAFPLGYEIYADLWWHFFPGQADYRVINLANAPSAPTAGQAVSFSGRVRNYGTYAGSKQSLTRLRLDIDNNGSWDGTWINTTAALAVNAYENESWPNAWTAVAGTHKYEICADEPGDDIFESNEANNCTTKTFTVTPGTATADISADDTDIPHNTSTTIRWTSTNATDCTVNPGNWTGTSGSHTTGNLTADRIYLISCNPGPATDQVTINVGPAPTSEFSLEVIKTGLGTVTSVSDPSQTDINCGAVCKQEYEEDTEVVLTATAAPGRIFTGWGGDCAGTNRKSACSLTIDGPKTVLVNFAVDPTYREF